MQFSLEWHLAQKCAIVLIMIFNQLSSWYHKHLCPQCNASLNNLFEECKCGNSTYIDIKAWYQHCFDFKVSRSNFALYCDDKYISMFTRIDERRKDSLTNIIYGMSKYLEKYPFANKIVLLCIDQIHTNKTTIPLDEFVNGIETINILIKKISKMSRSFMVYEMSRTIVQIPTPLYFTAYDTMNNQFGIIRKDNFKEHFFQFCDILSHGYWH